jgi:nitrile hydratase subunit beta
VNGPHDIGGMQSFGPVPMDQRVFHAPWEARAMAMTIALLARGLIEGEQARFFREQMRPVDYYKATYYERYLVLLETGLVAAGLASRADFIECQHQLAQTSAMPGSASPPTSSPPGRSILTTLGGGSFATRRDIKGPVRFSVGQAVFVRNINPISHTRLPRYVRGKRGTVQRVYPAYVFPDTNAVGAGEQPQHVYAVSFSARELWGETAEANESMQVDIWESHLEPA